MAKWEGFTEEDIKRVTASNGLTEGHYQQPSAVQVAKRAAHVTNSAGKKNVTRSRMLQKTRLEVRTSNETDKMPKEAFLSKPEILNTQKEPSAEESETCVINSNHIADSPSTNSNTTTPSSSPSHGAVCLRIKEGKSYEVLSGTLDEFQSRQKIMEEQNRRKKEFLAKAIADRKKQTTAEARRLQQIQDELQKLDVLLSNDVSILRNQIEAASLEFMEAQKRYNKAEKEFLDAKLLLFDKLERKEMLTEHLCTIIEQNEIRKARKLSELMDKLDIGVITADVCEDQHKNMILSPLYALDEVSYTACNTLKPRKDGDKSDACTMENAAENKTDNADVSTNEQVLAQNVETRKSEEEPAAELNSLKLNSCSSKNNSAEREIKSA